MRKNAVLVLSHLILNDMMKVKGYINEMAICLEDEDERIANLAKLFFHELSKKGNNPVYNLLPDILGKLSSQNLKEESFCNIMQFLIASIKKDKQMEALVEKLCNRFCGVTDVRLCEYISYCLSQLSYTDKSMRKLIELFKTYEHALSEDAVMDNFRTIINKGKKFAKPELKSCIEEFEEKLNKFHIERKEQELTAKNAQTHQQKVESLESITVTEKEEKIDESEITEDSKVTDPSVEAQTECSPSEPGCAVSEANSHASSEVTDSAIDELEVQSPISRTRGATKSRAKNSNRSDQNLDISNCTTSRAKNSSRNDQNLDTSNSTRRITRSRRRS